MKVTIPFLEDSFEKFNQLIFGGGLPQIPIQLVNDKTIMGEVMCHDVKNSSGNVIRREVSCIHITNCYDLSESEVEDVLIHEMIHYYIFLNNISDSSDHGNEFRKIMETVNAKYGRHITVRRHSENGKLLPYTYENKSRLLCLCQLQDEGWGILSSTKKRAFYSCVWLYKYFRIQSTTWFESKDSFFKRYPCNRNYTLYKVNLDEVKSHLVDAKQLRFSSIIRNMF